MPQKTVQDLDAYIKATAVVYDHSNTKLVSRKTKVSRRRKKAFLSVLPYRKPSSHYHSHERKTSSWITRKPRSKPTTESAISNPKQKLNISVQTPENADDDAPRTLSFQLDPGTSVQSLKGLIEKQIGVEARHQRLYIRQNFQLCDLLTLEDNGVDKNKTISLRVFKDDRNCNDVPKVTRELRDEAAGPELERRQDAGVDEESKQNGVTSTEEEHVKNEEVPKVTTKSRNEAVGPEPERRQDAGVDEERKQHEAASTEEEKQKNEQLVGDQDKPRFISRRYVQIFMRSYCSQKTKIMCLQVDPETSVLILKVIMSEKIGVHPQQQRLFIQRNFRNFELHNLLTLQDCGIRQDENISLRLCTNGLQGGGLKDTLPDDKSIWNHSKMIGTHWEELALKLNFSREDINIIKADHPNDTVRQCFEMLITWWRKQDNYTEAWQTLEKALIDSGRNDSVRGISAEVGRAHSSPSDAADQCRSELTDRYTTTDMEKAAYKSINPNEISYEDRVSSNTSRNKVCRATWETRSGKITVAVKLLPNFHEEEVLILARLKHNNIIKFLGVVLPESIKDYHAIVTEFAEQGSLYDVICRHREVWQEYMQSRWMKWAQDGAKALQFIHQNNYQHGDVKSPNFLVTSDDTLKICDFGISRNCDNTVSTRSTRGSFPWMAPEALGKSSYDPSIKPYKVTKKSDVYSFNVVIWELLSGEAPYPNRQPFQIYKAVVEEEERLQIPSHCPQHQQMSELLNKCWQADYRRRPTMDEVLQTLIDIDKSMS